MRRAPLASDRALGSAAAASAAALFGSAYVATTFQLRGWTPIGGALWRAILAVGALGIVMGWARVWQRSRATASPVAALPVAGRLGRLLVLGVLGGLFFIVGMNEAVHLVGATITAFVAGLYAILAALYAPVILGERLERGAIAGFGVALVGTALLAELGATADELAGLLWGGAAAVSYGLYLVLIRRWSIAIQVGPVGISLATAGCSAVGLAFVLAVFDPGSALPTTAPADAVLATFWLAVVTAFGPLLATAALRRVEASLASSLLLLNPITATVLSTILLAQPPSPVQLLGGLLVLAGMALASDLPGIVRRRATRPGSVRGAA